MDRPHVGEIPRRPQASRRRTARPVIPSQGGAVSYRFARCCRSNERNAPEANRPCIRAPPYGAAACGLAAVGAFSLVIRASSWNAGITRVRFSSRYAGRTSQQCVRSSVDRPDRSSRLPDAWRGAGLESARSAALMGAGLARENPTGDRALVRDASSRVISHARACDVAPRGIIRSIGRALFAGTKKHGS